MIVIVFIPEENTCEKHGFTYKTCRPFTKDKKRIKKVNRAGDGRYSYRNELHKACFQYDLVYGNYNHLTKRAASDKVLKNKTFNMANYPTYQSRLATMIYKFFENKSAGSSTVKPFSYRQQLIDNYANQLKKIIL